MRGKDTAPAPRPAGERNCPRCGGSFVCGNEAGAGSCWCAELPPVLSLPDDGEGCYCQACLRTLIAQQVQAGRKS